MKTILFLLIPILSFSQRFEIETIKGTSYLIQKDTSENGVITETKTPSDQIIKELDSKINSVNSQFENIANQRTKLDIEEKELSIQLDHLINLRSKLELKALKRKKSKSK